MIKRLLMYDYFKTIKSLSTWILLFAVVAFTLLSSSLTFLSKSDVNNIQQSEIIQELSQTSTALDIGSMSVVDWCVDSISGDFLLMFIMVFAVILVTSDYSSEYIKNIYGSIKNKYSYVLSKVVVASSFALFCIIISYITNIIFNKIVVHSSSFGDINNLLYYSFAKLLLSIAFSCLVIFISIIFRKGLSALVVAGGYTFFLVSPLYTAINRGVQSIFDKASFSIGKYTVIGNILELNTKIDSEQWKIISIIVIVSISFTILISGYIFSERDL
ncbi:MAG: hypothetical protein RSB70_05725 [Clostridium sp.]